MITGLSYLWEGHVQQAEHVLRGALVYAEAELGRRNRFTCMLAALLAAAVWERDRPAEAAALLADRLDVIEHSGLPEALLLAYRTAARVAISEGAEHRALELLSGLDAAAATRRLPRLRIAGLVEQIRLHARSYRASTCRDLCIQIDDQIRKSEDDAGGEGSARGPVWRLSVQALRDQALAYAAIAAQDWRGAREALARADAYAIQAKFGRLHIELLGLRALVLARCGEESQHVLQEAVDLATAYGLRRVLLDAHPDVGAWVTALSRERTRSAAPSYADAVPAPHQPALSAQQGGVLTPKERDVLLLLARNMSNKEIGRALDVGETTIKWHVKNLFEKLDAGSRKQVVQLARILGVIDLQS